MAGTRLAVRFNSRPAALAFREREHGRQLANARKHDLPAIRKILPAEAETTNWGPAEAGTTNVVTG
jgi:hypothetical protein